MMKTKNFQWQWLLILSLLVSAFALQAHGDLEHEKALKKFSETQDCVRPIPEMRRNHMELILHERDITMYQGIRGSDESLQGCINCHVSKDDTGQAVDFTSEKHFCNSCHQELAVSIDCFQCHNSKPTEPVVKEGNH